MTDEDAMPLLEDGTFGILPPVPSSTYGEDAVQLDPTDDADGFPVNYGVRPGESWGHFVKRRDNYGPPDSEETQLGLPHKESKDIEMFVVLRTGPTWQSIGSAIFDSYKDALDYAGLLDKAEVYRLVKPMLLDKIAFVRDGNELIEVKKFSDIDTNKVSVQFNNAIEQAKVKGCGVTVEMERSFIWDVTEDEDQPAGYVVYLEAPRD